MHAYIHICDHTYAQHVTHIRTCARADPMIVYNNGRPSEAWCTQTPRRPRSLLKTTRTYTASCNAVRFMSRDRCAYTYHHSVTDVAAVGHRRCGIREACVTHIMSYLSFEGSGPLPRPYGLSRALPSEIPLMLGWHYLSNATCLIRPHLFYACFVLSRIIIHCQINHRF